MPETAEAPSAPDTAAAPPATEAPAETSVHANLGEPSESLVASEAPPPVEQSPNLVNPDGTFVQDWTQKLPDEYADSRTSLAKYRNVNELIKAYQHANSLVGRKGLIPPTEQSSPEQVAEYRKQMGVPETPQAYAETVKPKVELPEGVNWDDGIANQYFELAHKNNIPASVMQQLIQLNLKQREFEVKAYTNQIGEKKQEGLALLRRDWGANFERNVEVARRAAAHYGIEPDDPGFASPKMVRAWVRAMNDMGEDKFVSGGKMPSGSADFASKAKDIQTNKDNPYYKRYWDGDADIQNMVHELHRKANQGR